MSTTKRDIADALRIIAALAVKDIVDALRNRTILFNVLTVFLLMALYQWLVLPIMYADDDLVVYDAGGSHLVTALENNARFKPRRVSSVQELKNEMSSDLNGDLGLVIPADFDQRLASNAEGAGEPPQVNGYVIWSARSAVDDLKAEHERLLTELVGQPVRIKILSYVYPGPDSMGPIRLVAVILVLILIFMGALTVPHLIFEEKRTRTLEALLVSPASFSQVVVGKALAGLFYCLTAAGVAFVFNWAFVTHWGLFIAGILCGALLAVGFGLLLGTFLERREQMMIWTLIPSYFLLGPVFLSAVDPILPEALRKGFSWIPTTALALVFRYSFSKGATLAQALSRLGVVALSAGLVLALVTWKVRRLVR